MYESAIFFLLSDLSQSWRIASAWKRYTETKLIENMQVFFSRSLYGVEMAISTSLLLCEFSLIISIFHKANLMSTKHRVAIPVKDLAS